MKIDTTKLRAELDWRKGSRVKTLGGIDTADLEGLLHHLDSMIAVNKKLHDALTAIADDASPFDKTGEPLAVRISKDLTRRIEIAKTAL